MFGKKKKKTDDRYYEGLSTGEAKAYARIQAIIDEYWGEQNCDNYGMLTAVRAICEYELRGNPYRRNVTLIKTKEKEL